MVAGDGDSKLWLRVLAVQTLVLPFFVWTICFFGTSKRIWTWKTSNSGLWMMVSSTWMCISNFVLPPCIPWVLGDISLFYFKHNIHHYMFVSGWNWISKMEFPTPGLRGAASRRVALGDEQPRSWAKILSVIGRMGDWYMAVFVFLEECLPMNIILYIEICLWSIFLSPLIPIMIK